MTQQQIILLRMLFFLPIVFIAEWLDFPSIIVFIASGLAIIPLAAFIADSTEAIAEVIGPSLGGLLNSTFGNATELIIAIVALRAGLVDVVKASITGTIVANLLLALGAAILLGGLRFKEQSFQPTVARINASSLNLALVVLLSPTAINFTSTGLEPATINHFSIVAAFLLLLFYGLSLVFSMKTHKSIYQLRGLEETNQDALASEKHKADLWKSVGILLICTIVLVFVSDTLVASLQEAISILGLSSLLQASFSFPFLEEQWNISPLPPLQ